MFVLQQIHQTAANEPDKLAYVLNGRPITYDAFWRMIEEAHRALKPRLPDHGIVVLSVDSPLEAWILSLAIRGMGLDAAVTRDAGQVALFADLDVAGVISLASESRTAPAAIGGARHLSIADPSRLAFAAADPLPPLPEPLGLGGQIILTSGTTGLSKMVRNVNALTPESVEEYAAGYLELGEKFRQHGPDTLLNVLGMGLWTGAGHSRPLFVWSLGGGVVAHVGDDIEQSLLWPGITHTLATPAYLTMLMALPEGSFPYLPDMQLAIVSGALTPKLTRDIQRRLTPRILINLSASELGVWARTPIETEEDLRWYRLDPTRAVEVVDDDDRPLPPGELGRVRVDLPKARAKGYLNDAEATATFYSGDWVYPGDLGVLDGKGRLALFGRSTDIVHIRGNKYPAEPWEREIQEALGCEGVCVLSGRWRAEEEELHLFIESRAPVSREALTAAVQTTLSGFPGVHIHMVQALPRTPSGKIRRIDLAQQLNDGVYGPA